MLSKKIRAELFYEYILNNYKNNLQDQNVQLVYLIINLEVVTRNSAIWYQITANVDFFDKYLLMCGYLTQRRYCYFLHYTGWKKIGFVQKKNFWSEMSEKTKCTNLLFKSQFYISVTVVQSDRIVISNVKKQVKLPFLKLFWF